MTTATVERPRAREVAAPPRPAPKPLSMVAAAIVVALIAGGIWSTAELRINVASLLDSAGNASKFVSRMFPLDFPPLGQILADLWETVAIVLLATALGIALSIPVAIWGAWNTTRNKFTHTLARFLIVLARAIPDLVLAIVFFRLFGLGGLPGVLAMGLHSVGMLGKLYSDSLEELPAGPEAAMRANGATRFQRVVTGYLPNWVPQLVSVGLYRFDINLRTSVLLGYVGVGGIGLSLANALRALQYQRGMALALIILLVCVGVELLSGAIRSAIHGKGWKPRQLAWVTGRRAAEPYPADERGRRLPPVTPPWTFGRVSRLLIFAGALAVLVLAFAGAKIDPKTVVEGIGRLPQTVGYFFPPMIEEILPDVVSGIIVTIQIALASTLLGALIAIPVGMLAARNVFPNRVLNTTFRVLIVAVRAIPDVILAIVMVVVTGLGGVAGTLALAIGSIGVLGKLVADALEETDRGPQEALRAHGASRLQVLFTATFRQVLPSLVSNLMYVLDSHVRAATLLGVVGAGGVGFLLMNAARVAEYPAITTIIIAILIVVLAVEALSIVVRKALR